MSNTAKNSIVVIGDLMLDVVTDLPDLRVMEIVPLEDLHIQNSIDLFIGGTASQAAFAATRGGFSSVTVIGKVGFKPEHNQPDDAAKFIFKSLKESGIKYIVSYDVNNKTGTAMITYLANSSRFIVSNRGANSTFNIEDVTRGMRESVRKADITFVSGYSFIVSEQANAVLQLIEESRNSGKLVVLDLVPHKFNKFVDKFHFEKYSSLINFLITEIGTIKSFLPEKLTKEDVAIDEIAQYLLAQYKGLILREKNGMQYLYNQQGIIEAKQTGYYKSMQKKPRGFFDNLTMKILYDYPLW